MPVSFVTIGDDYNINSFLWKLVIEGKEWEHLSWWKLFQGLPWWLSGWESTCQCRGHVFKPWSGRIPHAAEKLSPCSTTAEAEPVLWSLWATTTEPTHHNCWGPCAWSRCSVTGEATAVRGPCTAAKSSPRSPQLERTGHCTQQRRPSAAINK